MTQIKICGLSRECDIEWANECRPDYIGFILNFPKSRRNITPERACELRKELAEGIKAVGVTVDRPMEELIELARSGAVDVLQLHGHETDDFITELKKHTDLPIWKAFKVRSAEDVRTALSSPADAILLDNGYGTGNTFDWSLITDLERPFFLAGGLNPQNIPEAVAAVRPALVDLSSGVETDGFKDREKMIAAVRAAREE